jgi:hypothetical protein
MQENNTQEREQNKDKEMGEQEKIVNLNDSSVSSEDLQRDAPTNLSIGKGDQSQTVQIS